MAAWQAGMSGCRVLLAEAGPRCGGWLNSVDDVEIDGQPAQDWIKKTLARLHAMENVSVLKRTTLFGYGDHNYLTLAQTVTDHLKNKPAHLPRMRMWKVRAQQVILATGAIERPLVFSGNDLPGVMLASAAQTFLGEYGVLPGKRGIVMTNNDATWHIAFALQEAGCLVKAIVDTRPSTAPALRRQAESLGIEVLSGHGITAAHGHLKVARVEVSPLTADGTDITGDALHIDCDCILMSGGLSPVVHLHSQARGKLTWDEKTVCFRPSSVHEAEQSAGACNGSFDLQRGLKEAITAAGKAAKAVGTAVQTVDVPVVDAPRINRFPMAVWSLPNGQGEGEGGKAFVDFQNDVTASDIKLAVREGYHSVEHVKRYTTTGMATDQGRRLTLTPLPFWQIS